MASDKAPTVFGDAKVVDTAALAARAKASAENVSRGNAPDGCEYMNYSGKRGVCKVGVPGSRDSRTVDTEEVWLVNVTSFEDGWVCWKGGKPKASRMANIYASQPVQQPDMNEFGPFDERNGEGWFQAKAFVLKSLDDDTQAYFKINSISGVGAIADLIQEFSDRAATGDPCWPIIQIHHEDFQAQGYTNSKPVLKVYGWLGQEQMAKLSDPEVDLDALIDEASDGPPALGDGGEAANEETPEDEQKTVEIDAAPAKVARRRRRG